MDREPAPQLGVPELCSGLQHDGLAPRLEGNPGSWQRDPEGQWPPQWLGAVGEVMMYSYRSVLEDIVVFQNL